MITLYGYFRSSAAYRVRLALNLKGLRYDQVPVHLVRGGGEHRQAAYRERNPQGLVPFLADGDAAFGQSLAIIEYLDEVYPQVPLLPGTAAQRARIRAFALHIACEIHPLNNLRVLQYLTGPAGLSEDAKLAWYRHWIAAGLTALETDLERRQPQGPYCFGEQVTLADVCLVPQIFNAQRFNCDLTPYPRLLTICDRANLLPAFRDAAPDRQPDAE
jgi:maleylpyruvate isomerase